jgi:hypothetical protein
MSGNNNSFACLWVNEYLVAAFNAIQNKTFLFQDSNNLSRC